MSKIIKVTGVTESGDFLVGGLYTLKDTVGFPLDISYDVVKEKGCFVDWFDIALDAGCHGIGKYEAILTEIESIAGSYVVGKIEFAFAVLWTQKGKPTYDGWFEDICREELQKKRNEND